MTRVIAAARALCKQASEECGRSEEWMWTAHYKTFLVDAEVAIKAADEAQPIEIDNRLKRLESIVRSYRTERRKKRLSNAQ